MKKHVKVYMKAFGFGQDDIIPCEICSRQAIDIHHIQYKSQQGKDNIENLMALCRDHHDQAHFKKKPYLNADTLQEIHNKRMIGYGRI